MNVSGLSFLHGALHAKRHVDGGIALVGMDQNTYAVFLLEFFTNQHAVCVVAATFATNVFLSVGTKDIIAANYL